MECKRFQRERTQVSYIEDLFPLACELSVFLQVL